MYRLSERHRKARKVHFAACTRKNQSRAYSGAMVFRTICDRWYVIDGLTERADNATCLKCKAAIERNRLNGFLDCYY